MLRSWGMWFLIVSGILSLCGCGRSSPGSDANLAIERARQAMDADLTLAHDFTLAAMRVAPSDPSVFAWGVEFVKKTAGDDGLRDYAEDVYWRLDALIPFQPVDNIAATRTEHRNLSAKFAYQHEESEPIVLFDEVTARLKGLDEFPLMLQGDLLQSIRAEAVAMAIERGGISEDDWQSVERRLADAENALLELLWQQADSRLAEWRDRRAEFEKNAEEECAQPTSCDEHYGGRISDGLRLLSEITALAEALRPSRRVELAQFEREVHDLVRGREWRFNQHALRVLKEVASDRRRGASFDRLERLAALDPDRLIPYVRQRWEAAWNSAFDSLSDEEKVQAVKLRITRGRRLDG